MYRKTIQERGHFSWIPELIFKDCVSHHLYALSRMARDSGTQPCRKKMRSCAIPIPGEPPERQKGVSPLSRPSL